MSARLAARARGVRLPRTVAEAGKEQAHGEEAKEAHQQGSAGAKKVWKAGEEWQG